MSDLAKSVSAEGDSVSKSSKQTTEKSSEKVVSDALLISKQTTEKSSEKAISDPLLTVGLNLPSASTRTKSTSSVTSNLPPEVQRRVRALKNLQLQATQYEAEFYRKIHEFETSFSSKYKALNAKVSAQCASCF